MKVKLWELKVRCPRCEGPVQLTNTGPYVFECSRCGERVVITVEVEGSTLQVMWDFPDEVAERIAEEVVREGGLR